MSLLDYFAGQALFAKALSGLDPREAVRRAYGIAELMLEEKTSGLTEKVKPRHL